MIRSHHNLDRRRYHFLTIYVLHSYGFVFCVMPGTPMALFATGEREKTFLTFRFGVGKGLSSAALLIENPKIVTFADLKFSCVFAKRQTSYVCYYLKVK